MDRGPQTDKEWEQYSSHNIKQLQQLPISELFSLGEILKGIVVEYRAAIDNGEIPEEERSFTDLMLDVSKKRLDIVTMAKFKKIEQIFKTPKFK